MWQGEARRGAGRGGGEGWMAWDAMEWDGMGGGGRLPAMESRTEREAWAAWGDGWIENDGSI